MCASFRVIAASVLGEFGGVRLKVAGHHHGVHGWGYTSSKNCSSFIDASVELWAAVANMSGLSASVWTQLYDAEAEWNGLLTYDRVLKCPELTKMVASQVRAARRSLS